jgi:hypothetical protein
MCGPAWALLPEGLAGDNLVWFLAIGSISAALFSMAKSGFGGGVGMLSVPLMVIACGPEPALAPGIMLPMLIVADYVAVVTWWRRWDVRRVAALFPGVAIGIVAAWALLAGLQHHPTTREQADLVLKLLVGLIALGFVALHVVQSLRARPLAFRPTAAQATGAGAAAGLTSTFAHAAGPIAAMYLLPQQLPKRTYVATTAALFWTVNQLKLVPYIHLELINYSTLGAGLVLLPAIAAGAVAGRLLHDRVPPRVFLRIVYVLLGAAGVHLVATAAGELRS